MFAVGLVNVAIYQKGYAMKLFKRIMVWICTLTLGCTLFGCSNAGDGGQNGAILFALQNETLVLSTPVSNGAAYVYVDGEKKGGEFAVENKKLALPKFVFNPYAGKIVSVKAEFLDGQGEVISQKEYVVDVVDYAISTAEEFSAWYNSYKTTHDKGDYVILTNNITLNGGVLDNERMAGWLQTMYTGTFDGRGHVVYNFSSIYGFMPNVGKDGCIKNVAFVNMTTTGSDGFVGRHLCGTVENCYFQGQQTNVERKSRFTGFYSRYFDDANDNGYVKRVENVVIDVTRTSVGIANDAFSDTGFNNVPSPLPFVNVIMANDCYNGRAFYGTSNADITMYNSLADMKESIVKLPAGFSSDYWRIHSKYGLTFAKRV